jgi:SAM-dependent methyltransferase
MQKTILIDSSLHKTSLCSLAEKYKADKGPYSIGSINMGHRKGYTAVYEMFFAPFKNKKVNFLEYGLQNGDSLLMFKEFFADMKYYGIDNNNDSIERCRQLNVEDAQYYRVNVSLPDEINETLSSTNVEFDVILDDSSHVISDQLVIIKESTKYLKSGGLLIIEDLERGWDENIYAPIQDFINENFSFESFIVCHHNNRLCWDNDKIWIGIKK